jgi:8-oxo-dGTP diphosphatase
MTDLDDALRREIRQLVADIAPFDDVESDTQVSIVKWIDSGAPLFREHGATPPIHLAVFFAFLDDASRKIMLVDHRKAGMWLLPGGHNDGESPWKSVLREAEEELAVKGTFHHVIGDAPLFVTESVTRGPGSHTDVTLWFVLAGDEAMPMEPDEKEFTGVRWVSVDDVDAWVTECHAPQQLTRFVTKLTSTLDKARVQA